ncbi:MAG: hypothetical protein M3145_11365 [Pseudomonadota bacterium]|nr:hypothetical protein [Pseudomonadota bacterium]
MTPDDKLTRSGLSAVSEARARDLGRMEVLKVLGMINAVPEFTDHPKVISGCSDHFVECWARPAAMRGSLSARARSRATSRQRSRP